MAIENGGSTRKYDNWRCLGLQYSLNGESIFTISLSSSFVIKNLKSKISINLIFLVVKERLAVIMKNFEESDVLELRN